MQAYVTVQVRFGSKEFCLYFIHHLSGTDKVKFHRKFIINDGLIHRIAKKYKAVFNINRLSNGFRSEKS